MAGRITDSDRGGHRLRRDAVTLLESRPVAPVKRICSPGLDGGEAGRARDEPELARLTERLAERRRVAERARGENDPVGWVPATLLEHLQHDRLLALQPPGVDGVEKRDAEGLGGLASQAEARVEVTVDDEGRRPVREGLRQLAGRDLARGDEDERRQTGLSGVGGHRGRRVSSRGARDRRGSGAHGLCGGHGHAAVLEGARRVLALVLQGEVVEADPGGDRVAAVEGRVALGVSHDGPPARQEQLAEAPDTASRHRRVTRASPLFEEGAERSGPLARPRTGLEQAATAALRPWGQKRHLGPACGADDEVLGPAFQRIRAPSASTPATCTRGAPPPRPS